MGAATFPLLFSFDFDVEKWKNEWKKLRGVCERVF
jgi:hypothetical protein